VLELFAFISVLAFISVFFFFSVFLLSVGRTIVGRAILRFCRSSRSNIQFRTSNLIEH
jgi:hypothetical protein